MITTEDLPAAPAPATPADAPPPPPPASRDLVPGATLRPQQAPHAALGMLVLSASATRAAMHLSGADAQIALSVAGAALVIAVVAAIVAGVRLSDRKSRHRAVAFITVAGGWLASTVFTGVDVDAVAVLALLGYALSLHWWRKRRIAAPTGEQVTGVDTYATRWATYLGGKDAWKGTRLESREDVRAGVIRYVLRLVPGEHTYGFVMNSLEKIRGVFGLTPGQDIIVERHPLLAAPNLLLTIVTASPVKADQRWPGPAAFDPATGRISLGPFADGEGLATWKAYTKNRIWGGYLCGIAGTGKSRTTESIGLALAASESHPTVIFYCDGQGGASSPLLMKHADYSAGTAADIRILLAGVLLIMKLRQDENDIFEWEGFTPTDERPGLVVFVDESHKPLSKKENPEHAEVIQHQLDTIAREGGKVGVAAVLASQSSTLDAFGGAGGLADSLRSNLLAGNGVLFRCKSANAKQVFKVDVDPTQFPDLPGYAFLVDPEGRSAPFRGWYVMDDQRQYWPARITWRCLDPGAANSFGRRYLDRREIAAEKRRRKLESIQARRSGLSINGDLTITIPKPTPAAASTVIQFPTWDPAALRGAPAASAAAAAAEVERPTVTDTHRRLLDALHGGDVLTGDGFTRPQMVADALSVSPKWAGILLNELVTLGVLSKGDVQGRYYPTGKTITDLAA